MPIIDTFATYGTPTDAPADNALSITPSDSSDLTNMPRALCCLVSGTVRVVTKGGATVDLYLVAGSPLPIRVSRVHATGTTATGIVGIW